MKHVRYFLFLALFIGATSSCGPGKGDGQGTHADTDAETSFTKDTKDVDSTSSAPNGK